MSIHPKEPRSIHVSKIDCFLLVPDADRVGQRADPSGGRHSGIGSGRSESESLWVTSIVRLGTSDQFVAATADGLLLREAAVYSFHADNPKMLTKMYTHPAAVWCVASSSGGGRIASVDYRGNLVVYEKSVAPAQCAREGSGTLVPSDDHIP